MLLRFQKPAVRENRETGNQAFSMRLRFLTIGELAVDSFIRIEKRFEHKKPTLCVDDLGDANALLQNSSHFHKER